MLYRWPRKCWYHHSTSSPVSMKYVPKCCYLLQVTLTSTCVRTCSQLGAITCSRLTFSSSRTSLVLRYPSILIVEFLPCALCAHKMSVSRTLLLNVLNWCILWLVFFNEFERNQHLV